MIGIYWIFNLVLVFVEAVFLTLTLRNYSLLRNTTVGKLLVAVSAIFLVQSISMFVSFLIWAEMGYTVNVAGPLLMISGLGALGSAILYRISSM